ncbi:MAG: phosphatidate cytidylyltransferase [Alkalispirochaeta sp.]
MKRNTLLRLLVFFLGIPLLALAALAFPRHGLPVYGVIVIVASAIAAYEAAFFFPPLVRDYPGRQIVIPVLGAILPVVGYLSSHLAGSLLADRLGSLRIVSLLLLLIAVTVTICMIMAVQVLKRRETEIFQIINVVSAHIFILIYPGLFAWHAVMLATLPNPSVVVIVFILAVYLNDSMAWLVGRLIGPLTTRKDAPPPVAVSPNKSVAGFVGGFLASPIVLVAAATLYPDVWSGSPLRHLLFGGIIGIVSILGDLVESAFKRAATVKDSGQIIPGRGGLLDSIDSPLFTAPFFYYSAVLIYGM